MTMTKKDYELIEKAVSQARQLIMREFYNGTLTEEQMKEQKFGIAYVEGRLVEILRENNPKFDEVKFLKGCETYGPNRGFTPFG